MGFKIGDRVAVYRGTFGRRVGTVSRVYKDGDLNIVINNSEATYHSKQCRLLKKRERRRVWVNYQAIRIGTLTQAFTKPPPAELEEYIEFVEVRRKDLKGEK